MAEKGGGDWNGSSAGYTSPIKTSEKGWRSAWAGRQSRKTQSTPAFLQGLVLPDLLVVKSCPRFSSRKEMQEPRHLTLSTLPDDTLQSS